MKKIFPTIVVLIALSIIGVIIIQFQWFSNMLVVRGENFLYKVDKASIAVTEELSRQTSSGGVMRLQSHRDMNLVPDNLSFKITKPFNIADRFSEREIGDKPIADCNTLGLQQTMYY